MRAACVPFLARFIRSERGVSAVEFAFIFPALLVLMLAGTQLVTYINATRKVETLASSIAEMISQAAPPNNSTTVATLNGVDMHFAYDSALVIFPYLMKDAARQNTNWWQDISISYSSIQFTQISSNCATNPDKSSCYIANVVWTTTIGSNNRACVVPQLPASDTAPPSKMGIPRSVFGAGSIIVVDVVFVFKPTFASAFLPALSIARSVYVQPRYASLITYDNSDGMAMKCPGY